MLEDLRAPGAGRPRDADRPLRLLRGSRGRDPDQEVLAADRDLASPRILGHVDRGAAHLNLRPADAAREPELPRLRRRGPRLLRLVALMRAPAGEDLGGPPLIAAQVGQRHRLAAVDQGETAAAFA